MAALLENRTKELLARHGLQVPHGIVVANDEDVVRRAGAVRFPAVAKALIPIGKKGKAGAVRMVAGAGELRAACDGMIGLEFRGFRTDAVLVEDREEIEDELFLSFNFDGLLRSAVVVLGRLGGVDVEEEAVAHPDAFEKIPLDLTRELTADDLAQRWQRLGLSAAKAEAAARATEQAFEAFRTYDARVLEINPLAIRPDGACVAIGTLMDIDDEALFRQPELSDWVEYGSSRLGRQPTPLERKLLDLNARSKSGSLRFMEFPGGDLGCLLSGGGCSLWSTDHIIDQGGQPATYYDATTPSEDMLRALFEGVLAIPGLRGLVFGSNIINLARIESRVAILIETLEKMNIDLERFPVVLRMAGPGETEARRTAARLPHVEYYGDEVTLDYALDRFVERVNAAKEKYPG
jgi:succinyl-CoA synthetase beta subunit